MLAGVIFGRAGPVVSLDGEPSLGAARKGDAPGELETPGGVALHSPTGSGTAIDPEAG